MSKEIIPPPVGHLVQKILYVRGQKVILDSDLAILYGVTTGNLNKAAKRNPERFPPDFTFQLTPEELTNLKFQFGLSSWGGRRIRPYAFTEQRVAMLSSVLNSERAGERTRLACKRQSGSDRWRPRHRELFLTWATTRSADHFSNCFSARRRKEHAGRVCSPE
jgi:hypothetical protein